MGRTQDRSGTPLSLLGCLIDGFKAFSTPRSVALLQVYKRASSCAWTRQNTLHSTFDSNYVHELGSWTLGFRLFCVDRFFKKEFLPFNTKTDEREPSHTLTSRAEKTQSFLWWNFRFSHTSRSLPSKWLFSCHNKVLFHNLPLWWPPSRCLKSPLKRVFHILRITLWTVTAQFFCAASVLSRSKRLN